MLDPWLSPTISLLVLSWVVILRTLSEEDFSDGPDPKSESAYVHIVGFSLRIILEQCTNFFVVGIEPQFNHPHPRFRPCLLTCKSFAVLWSGLNQPPSDLCLALELEND